MSDDDRDGPQPRNETSPTALNSADPIRNFSLTVDERIRALTIGAPAWATRKRRIEDDEARHVSDLIELHDALVRKGRSAEHVEVAVLAAANALDLGRLNELVKTHNRYYPIEANLPLDRRTGDYLVYGRVWRPEEPYTAARLVATARAKIAQRTTASCPDD